MTEQKGMQESVKGETTIDPNNHPSAAKFVTKSYSINPKEKNHVNPKYPNHLAGSRTCGNRCLQNGDGK
jgi:hypothetical protein